MTVGLASLLGPSASPLRRWRILLAVAVVFGGLYLAGPYRPWRLEGHPALIPQPGESRIHIILVATYWAAAVNTALCALLLATSGLWAGAEEKPLGAALRRRAPALSLLLFCAAVLVAGALRWPLAHRGVWWDEAWSVRHTLVGTSYPDPHDETQVVFKPVSWMNTLFYYRKPTNHVLYSILARGSLAGWRTLHGAAPSEWNEFALRLPAYAAALLAVFALGVLVHDLGFPRAAPAAAFLLAIHPWHIRFGADGRGYSLMVLLAIVAAWCLLQGLRSGRWRYWLGYGAAQLGLLWVHALAFYYPLALAAAGTLGIAVGPGSVRDRALRFARFTIANVLAGMAYLQLMAPNLTQGLALGWEWKQPTDMAAHLGRQMWLYLATGLHRRLPWDPDFQFPTLFVLWGGKPWVSFVAYGVLPAIASVGCVRALLRPWPERWVWLGLAAAVPLALLHRALQGFLLIERFAIYGLIAVVPFLAIGLETIASALIPARARRVGVPLALAAGLAAFQAFVAPQTRVLLERPQMPSREIVAFLREKGEGVPGGVLRAGVALGGDVPDVYDPWVQHVHRREQIAALCRRSLAEHRPLYVFYGYNDPNRVGPYRKAFQDLDDSRYFEEVAHFSGIESDFVFRVFRYTGRPLGES